MHPLAIFILAAPAIGLIFVATFAATLLLTWLAGWRRRAALAAIWALWMAVAVLFQLTLQSDIPFSLEFYVLELVLVATGFVPAMPGAWIGARLRRRRPAGLPS